MSTEERRPRAVERHAGASSRESEQEQSDSACGNRPSELPIRTEVLAVRLPRGMSEPFPLGKEERDAGVGEEDLQIRLAFALHCRAVVDTSAVTAR